MKVLMVKTGCTISDEEIIEKLEHFNLVYAYDAVVVEEDRGYGNKEDTIISVCAKNEGRLDEFMELMSGLGIIPLPTADIKERGIHSFYLSAGYEQVYSFLEELEGCRIDLHE